MNHSRRGDFNGYFILALPCPALNRASLLTAVYAFIVPREKPYRSKHPPAADFELP